MTDAADADDGLLAGRYRRVRALGSGGMGDVWLAVDVELDRQVAVKRLRIDLPGGAGGELVERMMREARVVARLKHPSIVTLYDLVRVGGMPHLILEYVDGESLADRLARDSRNDWRSTARIIADTAAALAAAHEAGVQHRDVKPGNVLIDPAGRGHLADFGIARGTEDVAITRAGEMIGTLAFMPPEIARQEGTGPWSDVWSLGATFFAAVEGYPPFVPGGADVPAIIARLVREDARPPTRAGACTTLVTRMLASDPTVRPTAAEVATELDRILSGAPLAETGAFPPPAPPGPPVTQPVDAVLSNGPHEAATRHDSGPGQRTPAQPWTAPPPQPTRARRGGRVAAAVVAVVLLAGAAVGVVLLQDDGSAGPDADTAASSATSAPTGPDTVGGSGKPAGTDGFGPVDLGTAVNQPSIAPDGTGPVYVSDTAADQVVVVDPVSGEVTDRLDVCDAPSGSLAVAPGGARVFVPCGGPLVQVVEATGETRDVPVNGIPTALRIDPQGRYVLASEKQVPGGGGEISVIDAREAVLLNTLPTTGEPGQVQLAPDGSAGYSPDHDAGEIVRIDLPDDPDQLAFTAVTTAAAPNGVQVSTDDELVYVTLDDDRVQLVQRSTDASPDTAGETLRAPGASTGKIRVRPGTTNGWIPNLVSQNVGVLDLVTGDSLGSAATYGRPAIYVVFDPDGSRAFVVTPEQGKVKVIDADDLDDVTDLAGVGDNPRLMTLTPDGSTLYVVGLAADDPRRGTLTAVPLD